MKEIIEILRQQLILCGRILEISQKQQQNLVKHAAAASGAAAAEMEPLLVSLQKSEAAKIQLLRTLGIRDLSEAIAKQPTSREKEMALRLLEKLQQVMKGLKELNGHNQELLKRNMQYIDFNINVITQATAGTTYGASGGQPAQPDGGMKMFDTNI